MLFFWIVFMQLYFSGQKSISEFNNVTTDHKFLLKALVLPKSLDPSGLPILLLSLPPGEAILRMPLSSSYLIPQGSLLFHLICDTYAWYPHPQ